jgi:uncharacterized damage-inducible protein DinB
MHPLTTLRYAHKTLLDSTNGLRDADWDTPGVCGFWSVKQIIGHIIAWDSFFCEFVARHAGLDIPRPHIDDFRAFDGDDDKFNEKYGTSASSKTKDELLAELETVYAREVEICAKIDEATWHKTGVLRWAPDDDLEDYLLYAVYGHKYEHAAQIVVFRDSIARRENAKA